jgi:hypothetical protein
MLTIQDKIDYLNELISMAEFLILSLQQAIIEFPDHDKADVPTRSQVLSQQIAKKEFYQNQLKVLTSATQNL